RPQPNRTMKHPRRFRDGHLSMSISRTRQRRICRPLRWLLLSTFLFFGQVRLPADESLILIPASATAKLLVPLDNSLGNSWTGAGFDDSGWSNATTGVGFVVTNCLATLLASSASDFSGVQGAANWYYGYYNRSQDPDGTYASSKFTPFPNAGQQYG